MLSFTTDPYHPGDTSLTRDVLKMLQKYGLGICVLTKGGRRRRSSTGWRPRPACRLRLCISELPLEGAQ
jgi:hypothetical protein